MVAERLGHADVGITLDTYSHVLPNLQAQAAAGLEQLLAAGGDGQLENLVQMRGSLSSKAARRRLFRI